MVVDFQSTGARPRIAAGDILVLRIDAYDPTGIGKIMVQCFQFSMSSSNKVKLATGEVAFQPGQIVAQGEFEVGVRLPENAALGKWGVQMIEFTNGKGYKASFYRGHGKFDDLVFEVVSPPTKEDCPLVLNRVEIAGLRRA
ncbi:MAG TPA: hypothetical protein VI756_04105 [Blastocatellia bacterium]